MNRRKIAALTLIAALLINMVGLATGHIPPLYFWGVIIVIYIIYRIYFKQKE